MTKFNYIFGCRMVLALGLFCFVLPASVFAGEDETETAKTKGLEPILTYISKSWDTLTRSMEDCTTVVDPKLAEHSVLYLPADVPVSAQVEDMQRRCHVQVKALPEKITRPGQLDTSKLAKGMIENFFFEIEHYGTVLNANRSYYLSRSKPPFLTSMILAVYDAEK